MIDSHAHLDFPEFDIDRAQIFSQMHTAGIETALLPGVSRDRWDKQLKVAEEFACFYGLGIHPWYCSLDSINHDLQQLAERAHKLKHDARFVAIGECGLDKLCSTDWALQLRALESQLALAKTLDLPVILHVVKAHNEMLALLKQSALPKAGVVHGFYGNLQLAKQYIALGYKLGIGGLLLNQNANKLVDVIANISLDCILVETDSPAMTPRNTLDKRNTPLILPAIVQQIAKIQKKPIVLVTERVRNNVRQLFDI